jgi:hypothetical protein
MVVLGSAAHSYFVQAAWAMAAGDAAGTGPADIPFEDRLAWAAHDLTGMFTRYASLTSIALLIGFWSAGRMVRALRIQPAGVLRILVFGLAGGAAILAMFTLMRALLGTVGVFGARGPLGLAAQTLVGTLAGMLFARLTSGAGADRQAASASSPASGS